MCIICAYSCVYACVCVCVSASACINLGKLKKNTGRQGAILTRGRTTTHWVWWEWSPNFVPFSGMAAPADAMPMAEQNDNCTVTGTCWGFEEGNSKSDHHQSFQGKDSGQMLWGALSRNSRILLFFFCVRLAVVTSAARRMPCIWLSGGSCLRSPRACLRSSSQWAGHPSFGRERVGRCGALALAFDEFDSWEWNSPFTKGPRRTERGRRIWYRYWKGVTR